MKQKEVPSLHVDPMSDLHDPEADEEMERELQAIENLKEMPAHERRSVYAIKGLLSDYKNARAKFREELALIQIEHLKAAQRLHNIRSEIIRGVRDITDEELALVSAKEASGVEEIPSDDDEAAAKEEKPGKTVRVVAPKEENILESAAAAADGGIPNFWLTTMSHTEVLGSMITERDKHALSFLKDVTMEYIEDDPQKGVKLNFHFAPNEYFKNEVLSKTYCMCFDEDSGEVEIESMKATPVEWTSPEKNLTVVIKMKKQRHQKTNNIRVVKREEKCPSFFTFFTDPIGDDEDEDDKDDDEDDDEDQEAELHIEAGQLFMEELIPKAAFYYTGKSVEEVAKALRNQLTFAIGDDDDDEDDDDEEEEDEEEVVMPTRGGRGRGHGGKNARGGRGGASRGGAPQQDQQCKQQ